LLSFFFLCQLDALLAFERTALFSIFLQSLRCV
jgi:hypothetical protein